MRSPVLRMLFINVLVLADKTGVDFDDTRSVSDNAENCGGSIIDLQSDC